MIKIQKLSFFPLFLFFSYFFNFALYPGDYHNINNFFGERGAGMGGAFSALSDDTSGAYYNPAGLAFIQENHYSVNASSYKSSRVEFRDLFGPGQNYTRVSRNYLPNFLGFVRKFGKFSLGLSLINPVNDNFDQANRITLPQYRRNLSQLEISYTQENFQIQAGPSASYLIKDNFSIGLTGYYLYDSSKITLNQNENQFNNSVTALTELQRRRTSGFVPILGLQFMPFEKFSLGASLRRIFVTGGNISLTRNLTSAGRTGGPSAVIGQGSENLLAFSDGGLPIVGGGLSQKIPETTEIRAGWAYLPSPKLTFSMDVIHTGGYKTYLSQSTINLNTNRLTYLDPYVNSLYRQDTINYAVGSEFYITDNIVIRVGHYTNKSNNRDIGWAEGAVYSLIRNSQGPGSNFQLGQNLEYELPSIREVHANLKGYSFGIGFETNNSSVSIIVSQQSGKGIGFADKFQLPSQVYIKDTTIYITGGSKY